MLVAIMASCSTTMSNVGRTTVKEKRIAIGDKVTDTRKWETNDLLVNYTINNSADAFSIAGSIQIKFSVVASFPISESFRIFINFLDSNGTAISTQKISPFTKYRGKVPDQLKFSYNLEKPAGAVYYNFSYMGIFKSNFGDENSQEDWEIFHRPFEKKQ